MVREGNHHRFLFTQIVNCVCGNRLYGEVQKGHTYYRCHGEFCESRSSVREEAVEAAMHAWLIQSFGSDHMIVLAWNRAEAFQKRMLIGHLSINIQVRKKLIDVAVIEGDFEQSTWQSRLFQLLNEILLQSATFRPVPQIIANN